MVKFKNLTDVISWSTIIFLLLVSVMAIPVIRWWVFPANFFKIRNACCLSLALPMISPLNSTIVSAATIIASLIFVERDFLALLALALSNYFNN